MAGAGSYFLSRLAELRHYIFGPRLYRIFPAAERSGGRVSEANTLEWFGDAFIRSVSYAISLSVYVSPILAYYLYRRGITSAGNILYVMKFCTAVACGMAGAYLLRGYGRSKSPEYRKFITVLHEAIEKPQQKGLLQLYDFEFFAWPVDFRWDESTIAPDLSRLESGNTKQNTQNTHSHQGFLSKLIRLPLSFFEYCVAHGFARPLSYPGSVKLLQSAMFEPLANGRAMLIQKSGRRAKVLTEDGNEIDTMFIDKRADSSGSNAETLVICCEGNAAFYEVGCMSTPMNAGYSVLGWNHPGFAGSTGLPYPEAEKHAIDAVVRYAVTRLGFPVENIIMFAWSIGGFPAIYAATIYPDVKALILDATFDHVLPLAVAKMPELIESTVERVVKGYFNLNNSRHITRYPGPIRFIRRFQEEIITTRQYDPSTNRGNFLLMDLLRHRYPKIMTEDSLNAVRDYLSANDHQTQEAIKRSVGVHDDMCQEIVLSSTEGTRPSFPSDLGDSWDQELKTRIAVFLATRYMVDFDATHCIPLPASFFQMPWDHK